MKLATLAQNSLDDAGRSLLPALPAASESATADDTAELCRAAVLGFAGEKVRGTLGIATSSAGLARIVEHTGTGADDVTCDRTHAEDSLAELSNLLLGFIKRAWERRGLQVTMSTPLVIRGLSIEVCGDGDNQWFSTESSVGSDRITAWLDIHYDADLEVPDEDLESDCMAEGEPLLF